MIKIINRFNGMIPKIKYEFNNKWQPNNYKKCSKIKSFR